MKDSLYPNINHHDRYRTFEENFLEKRLVLKGGETPDGAEAAEAEGAAPDSTAEAERARLEQAQADGADFLKEKKVTLVPGMEFDAKDVVYEGEKVVSVKATFRNIDAVVKADSDVTKFAEYAEKLGEDKYDTFHFLPGSSIDLEAQTVDLHIDLKASVEDSYADELSVSISMKDDKITEATVTVGDTKKLYALTGTLDDIDHPLLVRIAEKVKREAEAELAREAEIAERIASFKGDEISQNDLLAPRGLSEMKAGDEVKYILKDGEEIAQVTITRTEEGYTATILDGRTGETGEISMGKDGGHFEMYGRRTEIKEDEDEHGVMTAQTTDGSVRTFRIKDDGVVEIVGDEEIPVEDPKALYKTMFSEEGLPPREADGDTEAPKEEQEDPAGTKEVTLQELRDMKDSLSTDKLKDLVGTTFKLKDAALTTSFTVREGDKGPQILVRMSGGNEYVVEKLGGEEGLSFTDQNDTKVDLLPGRHGVDIRVEGKWNGEDIKGKFKVNKEGDTMFKGKVSGKPFGGKVDLDRGTIDPNPRLFRSKEKTKELKNTFEGFLGTLQDFIAELMVMLEETGILDMFNMSLNKGNDPNKRASLFVLRNKLGTKNTGKLKTVKASKVMEAPADSTAQTMANLRGLGFDPSGTQGSGLMKVIAKVAGIQDEKKDDPQFDMGANESFFDYVSRTKMIDKNGFWSAEYQSYDPEAEKEAEPAPTPTPETREKKDEPQSMSIFEKNQESVRLNLQRLTEDKTRQVAEDIVQSGGFEQAFEDGSSFNLSLTEADQTVFENLLLTPLSDFEGEPLANIKALDGLDSAKKEGFIQLLRFLHNQPAAKDETDIIEKGALIDTYNIAEIAEAKKIDKDKVTVGDLFVAMYGDDWEPESDTE